MKNYKILVRELIQLRGSQEKFVLQKEIQPEKSILTTSTFGKEIVVSQCMMISMVKEFAQTTSKSASSLDL